MSSYYRMSYVIAIPSYKRSSELSKKTIETLKKNNIPVNKIFIFVVPEEREEYEKTCANYTIVSGRLGLVNQRTFIENYFEKDTEILFMDDDITELYKVEGGKRQPIIDLDKFITDAFLKMKSVGATMWGIYPVDNTMFMSKSTFASIGLVYIVGAFYGQINTRDVMISDDAVEDRERTILRYLRDGKVLRFNQYGMKTKYFAPGGMMNSERQIKHGLSSEALCLKYPPYVRLKIRRNGWLDCQIKNKN